MTDKLETCKNCKWWRGNEFNEHYGKTMADVNTGFVTFGCLSDKFVISDHATPERDRPRDGVILLDVDVQYGAEMGPDFGCIHWEVKLPF